MRRITHLLIVSIALVLSPLLVSAQDASPTASDCVAPELPPGTPTPMDELTTMASPAPDSPEFETLNIPPGPVSGEPADEETTARLTAAVENIVACLNDDDGLAFAALITPNYLRFSFGTTNPYDMTYFMEDFPGIELISVENVLVHNDGRFSVEVTQLFGDEQIDRFQALFVDQDGQLLLDEEIILPIEDADVTIEVSMVDFAFEMSKTTVPADSMVAFDITNDGEYPHEFMIIQLPDDVTVEQLLEDPEAGADMMIWGGVYADPGHTVSFALDGLPAGTYTVVCFLDIPDGVPHAMRGMVAELVVE